MKQSVMAGLNDRTDFTEPEDYALPLRKLIKDGEIPMDVIDSRVADVLRVKFELGLFDHPYVDAPRADKIVRSKDVFPFMLKMSKEALVLLKNKDNLLPLNLSEYKNILITGPLAEETKCSVSRYGPSNIHVVSVLEGIKKYVGNKSNVIYSKGCEIIDATWPESEIIETPLTENENNNIQSAVEQAEKSDIIIVVLGEGKDQVGESRSRTSLDLPGRQKILLQALYKTGKPVVLLLVNGRPLTINWADRYVPAIMECWFPGEAGGTAIAKTLFGEYNPSGKLTMTFPKTVGQIPFTFPYKPGANADQPSKGPNGYGDTRVNGFIYPFGYGLSYTSFSYSKMKINNTISRVKDNGNVSVQVDVTNTGKCKGEDIVQLYINNEVAPIVPYVRLLRGFERVSLNPGQTKTVNFNLEPKDFKSFDMSMKETIDPGAFQVMIGHSSQDICLKKEIVIE